MSSIKINGKEQSIPLGLTEGQTLYSCAEISAEEKLFLDVENEAPVPIGPNDYIVLTGDESFTVKSRTEDASPLSRKISITLNGQDMELSTVVVAGHDIRAKDTALESSELYTDVPGQPDQRVADDFNLVVRNNDCFITIPKSSDGIVDVEECARHNRKPPKEQDKYRIRMDSEKYITPGSCLSAKGILELAGKTWQEFSLQQKFQSGKRAVINPDDEVDFSTEGVERFETVPKHPQQG